tara:strand:+ start:97 stop:459 length:363 start_codon:yes stop_codon:yes gene_type:complete
MIRTSKENKEIVGKLTRRFGLGFENHISRIAFSYSINSEKKFDVSQVKNSSGKEYSKSVFFGDNYDLYAGLVCVKYNIHSSDKDILKYIKMHVDDGLEALNELSEEQGLNTNVQLINALL